MKPVHKSLTPLISATALLVFASATLAASQETSPPHLAHYDPAKGFKPAQSNLTEVFLQIAGSLECHGTPEPYLRHMQKEHARISRLYAEKTGKPPAGRMPPHMTDGYIDLLVKNWNSLSPPLKLETFAKEIGRCTREGIMGTRQSGTYAVQIFNEHQKLVADRMKGGSGKPAGFEELRQKISTELEFDREKIDMAGYDLPRRDAVSYSVILDGVFKKKFRAIAGVAASENAAEINRSLLEWFLDLGYLAQSELEIGILESALKQL